MTGTLTGRHALFIFLGFFITVTAVNGLMVTLAVRTFSGEDLPSAYVKGLNYNATLAARDAERRSGYAIAASASRSAGAVRIAAAVSRSGAPVPGDIAVLATLRHPTNAHLDRTVTLEAAPDGGFATIVEGLAPGQWDLVVVLRQSGETIYEARTRQWLR